MRYPLEKEFLIPADGLSFTISDRKTQDY